MPRKGYVIEVNGDTALISTTRRGVCDECHHRSSCSLEEAVQESVPDEVLAKNPLGARVGDLVEFELPGHAELKLSLLVWAAPLAGMVAGGFVGSRLFPLFDLSKDVLAGIGAFSGLAAAYLPLYIYDRVCARDNRLLPRIIRIGSSCSQP